MFSNTMKANLRTKHRKNSKINRLKFINIGAQAIRKKQKTTRATSDTNTQKRNIHHKQHTQNQTHTPTAEKNRTESNKNGLMCFEKKNTIKRILLLHSRRRRCCRRKVISNRKRKDNPKSCNQTGNTGRIGLG